MAKKGNSHQTAAVTALSPTRSGRLYSQVVHRWFLEFLQKSLQQPFVSLLLMSQSVLWGRVTQAMIPPRPLREGRALDPQTLLVVGGGASNGWRKPSAFDRRGGGRGGGEASSPGEEE
ncbi:UNVERIFIED_CONTAM: hypothetical protein Slati_3699000 [Sesamum latifolium]|uniref:Uncharacterized protein n=1 Tax=Sesamum latifolium TaxID=2727402 RepID=A0AAW2U3H2_9LAMI